MTSEECLSKVLSSPDLKCPICQKNLEVWVYGEVPLYRCSICGGLGFKLGPSEITERTYEVRKVGDAICTCPGCGEDLRMYSLGKLKVDICPGCEWAFLEDGGEPLVEEESDGEGCSHYESALRSLGKRYELVISNV